MKILKLEDLVIFKTAVLLFKAKNSTLPPNIQRLFIKKESKLQTRQKEDFYQLSVRTTFKAMSLSVCGVKVWNNLNIDLRNSKSERIFKLKLKSEFIDKYKEQV